MLTRLLSITAMLLLIAACSQADGFEEGRHYTLVSDEATEQVQIEEFFSFYCPACYEYQPFNALLRDEFDGPLIKYHIDIQGLDGIVPRMWATAVALDVESEYADRVFDQHFEAGQQKRREADFRQAFFAIGVSENDFENAYDSSQTRRYAQTGQMLISEYEVNMTPTYVVNGRYKMNPRAFRDSDDFFADFLALAQYLSNNP